MSQLTRFASLSALAALGLASFGSAQTSEYYVMAGDQACSTCYRAAP